MKRKPYDLRKGPIRKQWWIFLLPLMAAFTIGFVWPFIQGIYLSFCTFTTTSNAKLNGVMNNKAFFNNYIKAFQDPTFVRSFWYSASRFCWSAIFRRSSSSTRSRSFWTRSSSSAASFASRSR